MSALQKLGGIFLLVLIVIFFGRVGVVEAIPMYPTNCVGVNGVVNDGTKTLVARGSGENIWNINKGDRITFESFHPGNPNLWDGLRLHVNNIDSKIDNYVDKYATDLQKKPTVEYVFNTIGRYNVTLDVFAARWIYWGTRNFDTLGGDNGGGPGGNRLGNISLADSTCQTVTVVVAEVSNVDNDVDSEVDDGEDEGTEESLNCFDWDGDGWGWDGEKGCRMSCFDWDGDGWGWDGEKGCQVVR